MVDLALADAHRVAQVNATVPILRLMEVATGILSPADLDGSFPRFARVALPVISAGRARSGSISLDYYRRAREAAGIDPADAFPVVAPEPTDVVQLTTSMSATGPGYVKAAIARGQDAEAAIKVAQLLILRATKRHVLNGGRSALTRASASDPRARGWSRVSDGSPCHFCAMLVSRGPVYSDTTVRFRAHDGCGCGVAVAFHGQDGWTPQARAIREVYDANPGSDFRAAWDRRLSGGATEAIAA